jgi:prephenate dehydrogenase
MKTVTLSFDAKNNPSTLMIIGYGRLGQLLTQIFLASSTLAIQIVSSKTAIHSNSRVSFVELREVKQADLIIPCVPISAFKATIKKIAPFLKSGSTIMDVCSVKVFPTQVMKKYLPKNVQIINSHPMFGPDSYALNKGLKNLRLVLCNLTAEKRNYAHIKSFFKKLGLKIFEFSPEQHDKFLSWSLGYSFLIGKIGQRLNIKETPIDTYDFQVLLQNKLIVSNDSEQLFMDMQTYNPFAKEVQKKFLETTRRLLNEIEVTSKKLVTEA